MGIAIGVIGFIVLVPLLLYAAISRWARVVPSFGRWINRHFPRAGRALEVPETQPEEDA